MKFLVLTIIILLNFFNKKYIPRLKINYWLKNYRDSLGSLSVKNLETDEMQLVLNKITSTGINLILRLLILLLPCFICAYMLLNLNLNNSLIVLLSMSPYIYFLSSRK